MPIMKRFGDKMLEFIEYINLPTGVAFSLVGIILLMNAIGEFLALKGKIVPEYIQMRKYFKRKREERETLKKIPETLDNVQALLDNVNQHYSADNITMRNSWMEWVNKQANIYDVSIAELEKKMDKNNEITLSLLIDNKRNFIIDFASKAADLSRPITREQYRRFFKVHKEYEELIAANGITNGEVDVAYRIGEESYEERTKKHAFLEDMRGYDIKI